MLEVSENDEMAWRMPEKCDWNRLDVVKYGKMCKNQAGLNIAILSRKISWYDDVGLKYSFETSPIGGSKDSNTGNSEECVLGSSLENRTG